MPYPCKQRQSKCTEVSPLVRKDEERNRTDSFVLKLYSECLVKRGAHPGRAAPALPASADVAHPSAASANVKSTSRRHISLLLPVLRVSWSAGKWTGGPASSRYTGFLRLHFLLRRSCGFFFFYTRRRWDRCSAAGARLDLSFSVLLLGKWCRLIWQVSWIKKCNSNENPTIVTCQKRCKRHVCSF